MPHDIYLVFDQSHLCRLSQAYLLFLYDNHDPLRVFLHILFRVLFRVLLKGLGFPRFIIGYAAILYFKHIYFSDISSIKKGSP